MGIFDGIDAADVDVPTFEVKVETLFGTISKAEVRTKEETGNKGLIISWSFEGREYPVTEYLQIPLGTPASWDKETPLMKKNGDPMPEQFGTEYKSNMSKLGALKARFLSLGIPETRLNEINPEADLEGLTGNVKIGPQKDNPSYARVISVSQPGASGTALPKPKAKAAAKPATPVIVGEDEDDNPFEDD